MHNSNAALTVVNEATRQSNLHNHGTRLLSLPAEIRNMIWRWALVEEDALFMTPTVEILPPLARVCHQIYYEASFIFFTGNRFLIPLVDYDASWFCRFAHIISELTPEHMDVDNCEAAIRLSPFNTPNAIKTRQAHLIDWVHIVWKCLGRTGKSAVVDRQGNVDWRYYEYRWDALLGVIKAVREQGLEWEQARVVLVPAIELAGICGEESLGW